MSTSALDFTEVLLNDDKCQCGRIKNKPHCPYCGRQKTYGYEDTISRTHPQTGILYQHIRLYKCHTCGRKFDDFQWFYECHAPLVVHEQRKLVKTLTAKEHMDRAISGVVYNENDKRHFKKMTAVDYNDFMRAWKETRQKMEKIELDKQAYKLAHPGKIEVGGVKLTPLQAHIENCNYCMTHDDNCAVGKQLITAEGMEQP